MGCTPDCTGIACTNGTCGARDTGAFCNCAPGWEGAACDSPVNVCLTGTRCMNNGVCVSTGPNSFQCDCVGNFGGDTCQTALTGCDTRPCVHGSCSGASVCTCERGYSGATCNAAFDSCDVTPPSPTPAVPCANGTCADLAPLVGGSDFTCTACGGFEGRQCEVSAPSTCGAYVDIVYRIAGTFRVSDTPLNLGNVTKTIGTNALEPQFARPSAGPSPFPPATFANGHIRLRFQNEATGSDARVPGAGPVQIIEWYVPLEFDVSGANIPTVRTNVDHSAGMIQLDNTRFVDFSQTLSRPCNPVANGVLSGTTLTWDTCDPAVTPAGGTNFTTSVAQANVTMNSGCLRRVSSSGNTRCIAGSCALVPNRTVGDQRATWDQTLPAFVFSGTNYETATFSMPEIQLANNTGTTTYLTITSATPGGVVECSSAPTCDEECDADSCQQ